VLDTACRPMLLTTLAEGPRLQAAASTISSRRAPASKPGEMR
jgi:hypothetical protein